MTAMPNPAAALVSMRVGQLVTKQLATPPATRQAMTSGIGHLASRFIALFLLACQQGDMGRPAWWLSGWGFGRRYGAFVFAAPFGWPGFGEPVDIAECPHGRVASAYAPAGVIDVGGVEAAVAALLGWHNQSLAAVCGVSRLLGSCTWRRRSAAWWLDVFHFRFER